MIRNVYQKLTSILLIICMVTMYIPTTAFAVGNDYARYEQPQVDGYVSDDNGYIKYYVDVTTGGFYILPSDQPFDGTKSPSFGSFRLNGAEYVFGGNYPDSEFVLPPVIGEGGTCQTEWRIGDVKITQFLNIIQADEGNNSYAVYIRYEMLNPSVSKLENGGNTIKGDDVISGDGIQLSGMAADSDIVQGGDVQGESDIVQDGDAQGEGNIVQGGDVQGENDIVQDGDAQGEGNIVQGRNAKDDSPFNIEGIVQDRTIIGGNNFAATGRNGSDPDISFEGRILLDTVFGTNDAMPVTVSNSLAYITNETAIDEGSMPDYYSLDATFTNVAPRAYGLLVHEAVTSPRTMAFAHFNNVSDTVFDYVPDENVNFMDAAGEMGADSAVLLYFEGRQDKPGEPVYFSTIYGFEELVNVKDETGVTENLNLPAAQRFTLTPGESPFTIGIGEESNPTVVGFGGRQWVAIGHNGIGVASTEGTLTLLTRDAMKQFQKFKYADDPIPSQSPIKYTSKYADSDLQMYLHEQVELLPQEEKAIMVNMSIDGNDEQLWPLSEPEALSMNVDVRKRVWKWWLRPGQDDKMVAVFEDSIHYPYYDDQYHVVAATVLDLQNVVFASAATGAKAGSISPDLKKVEPVNGAIKFTVKDSSLNLGIEDVSIIGDKVSFSYANATQGKVLSAAITDNNGNLRYYGQLANSIYAEGSAEVNLPADISETDEVLLFVETMNNDNVTDFCSEPYRIALRPNITTNIGGGFVLKEEPSIGKVGDNVTVKIAQDASTFVGGAPSKAVSQILVKDEYGHDIPFLVAASAGSASQPANIEVTFKVPFGKTILELVSTDARRITAPENERINYVFTDLTMRGIEIPANAAAAGHEITLSLMPETGITPDSTISLMDAANNQIIEDVQGSYTSGGAGGIYSYTFTMPDKDIVLLFDTVEEIPTHYSVTTYVPSGRAMLTLWKDGDIVEDGRVKPGETVRVEIGGLDKVHTNYHGIFAQNYISGAAFEMETVKEEESYTFTMPKHSVLINLDVRQKPVYTVSVQSSGDATLEILNERSKIASKESVSGYIGDNIAFFVTNGNIRKTIQSIQLWKMVSDVPTSLISTIPNSNPYGDRFAEDFMLSDQDVQIKVVLEDAPPISVEVKGNLPEGNAITLDSSSILLGDKVSFQFETTDTRYLLYRPVMQVYDAQDGLLYEHLFDNEKTHTGASETYESSAIDKTSGIPAKIVLDVRERTVTFNKELHSIVPNSSKKELFKSIDVIGLNMYEGDIGGVYFGTSPNPTQSAAEYITSYGERQLTITVPQDMLPDEADVTYYVSINGVEKSCTVNVNRLLRTAPFGWLAIVSDPGNQNSHDIHSIIVADSESELIGLKGSKTFVMRFNGAVKYDDTTGAYSFSEETPVLINNTATFTASAENPLSVRQMADGELGTADGVPDGVVISARKGKMSVPGYTFVDGQDITAELVNGTKYSAQWAKNAEGEWTNPGVKNVVFDYKTFGFDATIPVLGDGMSVKINQVVLLENTVIFGGKLLMQLTAFNIENLEKKDETTKVDLKTNKFEIDVKRLAFGNDNGNFGFKGVEGMGEIALDSLEVPNLGFSGPSGKLEVNTFTNEYAIEAGVDIKLVKVEGRLSLAPLNNGWPMIDSFKAAIGSEPGMPIIPIAPIGYITSGGAGFSGLVKTINGNFDAIPPFMISAYGSLDLVKLLEFDDVTFNLGPSEISFAAKPKIMGIEAFKRFGGGVYITSKGVRFTVAADLVLIENFEVIMGGGNLEVSYLDRKFSFSGSLYAKIQVPRIKVADVYAPEDGWKVWSWVRVGQIDVGPLEIRNMYVGINEAAATANFSVLGYGLKAEYRWGASRPTVTSRFAVPSRDTLEVEQNIYDDNGDYAGYAAFGGNLSLVTSSGSGESGNASALRFGARSFLNEITISHKKVTIDEAYLDKYNVPQAEREGLIGQTFDDPRYHTLVFPQGIEADEDDYALLISAEQNDIRITRPDGKPFVLKYADGELNAAGLNAVVFSDDESRTIMIRLPKAAGTWQIESSNPFGSAIIAVAPLPQISKVKLDGSELAWEAKNLSPAESYAMEIRMAKDDGSDTANADPGILIQEIPVTDHDGVTNGTYAISNKDMSIFESGDYYPVVSLVSVQNGLYNDSGELLAEGSFKSPKSTQYAATPYTYINPLQPGEVTTVTVSPAGSGALNVKWSKVDQADGYIVSVFDEDGNPAYLPVDPNGEVDAPPMQIMYDLPAGEGTNNLEANLGGVTPGAQYCVEVAAYRVSSNNIQLEDGGSDAHNARFYGKAKTSNIVEVPLPVFPVINVVLPGSGATIDDMGNRTLYVNNSFNFAVSASQNVKFTVEQGEKQIYTSQSFESAATVNVDVAEMTSASIQILAVNERGDMTHYNFDVCVDDVPPPLFISTDDESTIFTDNSGAYVITGRSEPYANITDDLGNNIQANAEGEFQLHGSLAPDDRDMLRSIRATDKVGNHVTSDILIKKFADVAAALNSVSITPATEVLLSIGDSFPVKTKGELANGQKIDIATNAVSYNVFSGASNISVNNSTGRITAVAAGRAEIAVSIEKDDQTLTSGRLAITILQSDSQGYIISFNANGGTVSEATRVIAQGASIGTLPTATRENHSFDGWYTAATGGTKIGAATIPDGSSTYFAHWIYTGGGASSGSTQPIIVNPPAVQPNQPTIGSVTAKVQGNAFTITDSLVKAAIDKAQSAAKTQRRTANGVGASLVLEGAPAEGLTLTLDRAALNRLVTTGAKRFDITGAPLSLGFDAQALSQLQKQGAGNVTIAMKPVTAKGVRNAHDITLSIVKDGKTVAITNLGTGMATLSIPTTPAKNEAAGALYAVYVDDKGKITRIADSFYDANSGSVIFNTNHFSVYGVAYAAPAVKVTDIATHWAKESINYVMGRGLLGSTAQGKFNPNAAITRGELVTALGKLAGINTKAYTKTSFTDVKADSEALPYIAWASSKGILTGITGSRFAPEKAVTRQEVALILQNYAKATGYKLPVTRTAVTFADASSIGSTYKTSVKTLQQAGIVVGEQNNKFNPTANITRAEVSATIHRYIKLSIDPATAQGWAKNDDGQYQYYKDGKAVTGTQTIDGVKYVFNPNGTLKTGWVQEGSNWRYYSGNTMVTGWRNIGTNGVTKRYYFDAKGNRISGKWVEIGGAKYYFEADGALNPDKK